MRKLIPELSSPLPNGFGYIKEHNEIYSPYYVAPEYVFKEYITMISIGEASARGLLFAYPSMGVVHYLSKVADKLNEGHSGDLETMLIQTAHEFQKKLVSKSNYLSLRKLFYSNKEINPIS